MECGTATSGALLRECNLCSTSVWRPLTEPVRHYRFSRFMGRSGGARVEWATQAERANIGHRVRNAAQRVEAGARSAERRAGRADRTSGQRGSQRCSRTGVLACVNHVYRRRLRSFLSQWLGRRLPVRVGGGDPRPDLTHHRSTGPLNVGPGAVNRSTGRYGPGGTPMPRLAHRVAPTEGCHVRPGSYRPVRTRLRHRVDERAMVFVGVHGEWGRIDVTQADLGCGQDRESIYKAKRPAPLTCYECDWRLHLVHKTHGPYDLWFLRHANNAPRCEARAADEGMAHHLLKLDLAHHARAAGWSAEYEVAAPAGSWRADVMAISPDGSRRVALEAQMASISVTESRPALPGTARPVLRCAGSPTARRSRGWTTCLPPRSPGPTTVALSRSRPGPPASSRSGAKTEQCATGVTARTVARGSTGPCRVKATVNGSRPRPSRWNASLQPSARMPPDHTVCVWAGTSRASGGGSPGGPSSGGGGAPGAHPQVPDR
jgi:hypothetical protein